MKIKNILVTLGAVFIGFYLNKGLIELGRYVVCLDNLLTGSISNIQDLKSINNFEFAKEMFIK